MLFRSFPPRLGGYSYSTFQEVWENGKFAKGKADVINYNGFILYTQTEFLSTDFFQSHFLSMLLVSPSACDYGNCAHVTELLW